VPGRRSICNKCFFVPTPWPFNSCIKTPNLTSAQRPDFQMIQLRPTQSVLDIAQRLERGGFEAWCVGGAIRDALLGGTPLDWDLATSAKPEQVVAMFGRKRTIPVGIEFGTVRVMDAEGVGHEITTFRRDVKTDGRHAEVEFGASLDDDLARRDFTINAIAFRPATGELRDPFGGQRDLAAGIVRAVGDAEERMREDRLRALRAIRFAARYGFAIHPQTHAAIESSARHLTRLSAERVQQELVKTMQQVARPSRALVLWRETGALRVLVPALGDISDVALATLDHLARDGEAGRNVPMRTSNRIAALFLDSGGAAARHALQALRFSKHEINWTGALATAWGRVRGDMERMSSRANDTEVRRWVATIGRLHAGGFMRIARARWCAEREAGRAVPDERAVRSLHRRLIRTRFDAIEVGDLAIGGDDLRAAGIPPGPMYTKILGALLERVIEAPARNTPEALLADLPGIVAALNGGAGAPPQH
jgi:tRNA nucleotidyltransferase (CCA-adding enzyme)